ncbi:hypothetical protein ACIBQX_02575 [Nonomuraea sp. NPDC049714]|uniref:hypothetical protein n=1 Tax=Nonomuraea sp. NPDC049714 TaxID=3364357 RepID=UPI00379BB823
MLIERARRIARQWVLDEGARLPGFAGALLTGSALWAHPDTTLPDSSDVDVLVVLNTPSPPPAAGGKFLYDGVLLEVSFLSWQDLAPTANPEGRDPGPTTNSVGRELDRTAEALGRELGPAADLGEQAEAVLGHYHLAGAFHRPGVLADPTGRLTAIQRVVARHFADRRWVLERCTHAENRVRGWITGMDDRASLPEQVAAWLFGTGVTTHVLLVAGLRNPTVRRRYEAVRELLVERGLAGHHEHLLDLLGCAELSPERVRHHLHVLERVFDLAKRVRAPSYRFASDITEQAEPIAIGGGHDLVDKGLHREAVFWLVATHARCLAKLSAAGHPAPADGLTELLADLGAETSADRRRRGDRVMAALPGLRHLAESLAPP